MGWCIIREVEFINRPNGINAWEYKEIDTNGNAILTDSDKEWLQEDANNKIIQLGFYSGDIEEDDNDGFTNCETLEEAQELLKRRKNND